MRAPSGYDPINNPERSRARFVQVLDRLVDDGYITEAEATRRWRPTSSLPERTPTHARSVSTRARTTPRRCATTCSTARTCSATRTSERYNTLFRGGLRIHTTFDPDLQAQAEEARNVLPDTPQGFDAAIVSLDTSTGAIRAMVGGRGFVPNERETNMALAPRQTGSSIKFFILAAALQAGAQPDDVIDGADTVHVAESRTTRRSRS